MPRRRREAQDDLRFRILNELNKNPEISQRQLAAELGLSVGGLNYALRALIEKGFVKLGNFSAAEDKRRYAYILTPKGMREKAALTRSFLSRKMAEYEAIRAEIDGLRRELGEGKKR